MPKFQVKYYLFFVFSLIFFCIPFLVMPLEYALNFANDDSFFYLKIAKNITKGPGITFDGPGSAGGFHLLYPVLIPFLFPAAAPVMNRKEHVLNPLFYLKDACS